MSDQVTGKHLSRQPSSERKETPAEQTARPVSTARTARPVRPVDTARSGSRAAGASGLVRAVSGGRSAGSARPASGGQNGWYEEPPRPSGPSGGGRRRPAGDMFIRFLLLGLLLISMAVFVLILYRTKMLTGKLLLIIAALLLVLFVIVAILMLAFGKKGRPWGGIIISVLLTVVMAAGSVLGEQGTDVLQSITSKIYNVSHIGVYVRDDDTAQSLQDIAGYTFGIMETMSHEGVDKAIADINEQLGMTIQTTGFGTPTRLVNALFDGTVNAVIADASYIDGLREVETYTEIVNRMREITDMHVQIAPQNILGPKQSAADTHVYTVLITGIDSRNGLVRSSLSDVNILVTVNTETRQVLLVSTPRDYCVPFSDTGVEDKLTHAGWLGEEVCMGTIGNLYDVDIDYYFRINFEGFVNIIDALGGITVISPHTFDTVNVPGYHFDEGPNDLNGTEALVFARERKAFKDGDEQRGRNQLALIRAIIDKVMSPEILTRYSSLMSAVEGCFETTVPYDLIASLVRKQLDEGGDWNVVSYSVSGEGVKRESPALGEVVYMMIPDETTVQTAKDMMAQVRNGEVISAEGMTFGTP